MEVSLSGYKVVYGDKVLNALSLIGMRLKHPERQEEYEKPISKPDFISVLAINTDGTLIVIDDETQFTAFNMAELEQLWREFCKENSFAKNSVDYVERA